MIYTFPESLNDNKFNISDVNALPNRGLFFSFPQKTKRKNRPIVITDISGKKSFEAEAKHTKENLDKSKSVQRK